MERDEEKALHRGGSTAGFAGWSNRTIEEKHHVVRGVKPHELLGHLMEPLGLTQGMAGFGLKQCCFRGSLIRTGFVDDQNFGAAKAVARFKKG